MNILAIDIGGTYIKYALMDENSEFFDKGKVKTPKDSRENLIDSITSIYKKYDEISGIAISMPGIIDSENGYCRMGGALKYNDDFYFRDELYKNCPVDIVIINDAKSAVVAEATLGNLSDVEDGFALIFGTMIGGGYVKNHELVMGKHFSAGEVSYIITDSGHRPDKNNLFGNRCGTPKLCHMYANLKGLDNREVDGLRVFNDVLNGDTDAISALEIFTNEIAVEIFNIQNILDPERVVIGGGISEQEIFIDYIKKNLEKLHEECPYDLPHSEVMACKFHNDANLIGAAQTLISKYGY